METSSLANDERRPRGRRPAALDWLAFVGGLINLVVIVTIIAYWLAD